MRKPKIVKGEDTPISREIDALTPYHDFVTTDLRNVSKPGMRLYGAATASAAVGQAAKAVPAIPGMLGATDAELAKTVKLMGEFTDLQARAADARRLTALFEDSARYRLHEINVFLESLSSAVEAKPEFAERVNLVLDHVRAGARKAARTRKAKTGK